MHIYKYTLVTQTRMCNRCHCVTGLNLCVWLMHTTTTSCFYFLIGCSILCSVACICFYPHALLGLAEGPKHKVHLSHAQSTLSHTHSTLSHTHSALSHTHSTLTWVKADVGHIQVFVGSMTGIRKQRAGGNQRTAGPSIASVEVEGRHLKLEHHVCMSVFNVSFVSMYVCLCVSFLSECVCVCLTCFSPQAVFSCWRSWSWQSDSMDNDCCRLSCLCVHS